MQTLTFAEMLSDLRYVCDYSGARYTELDDYGAAMIELGLAERLGSQGLRITLDGVEVLHATRDVVLTEAA